MKLEWAYQRAGQPAMLARSRACSFVQATVRAIRPFLLGWAVALAWTNSAQGAEPNTAKAPAPAAVATQAKADKPRQASLKSGAAPATQNTVASPTPAPDPNTQPAEESDSNSVLTDQLRSRLWKGRVVLPDANDDATTKAALQDLIQRLKNVGRERPVNEPAPATSAVSEPSTPVTKKTEPAAAAPAEPSGLPTATAATEPNEVLPPAVLQKLNALLKDPNQVHDPLEMAELLFLNNRLAEAAVFYEKALTLTVPNDQATADDRAWILYQLGTSLRQANMGKAQNMYLKLITEFPNSPWTELAKANGRLINWYQDAKPQQLISSPNP
jgi:hypothetical protein